MLRRTSLDDLEQASCQLAPKIQHRIIRILNEEVSLFFFFYGMTFCSIFKFWIFITLIPRTLMQSLPISSDEILSWNFFLLALQSIANEEGDLD